MCVRGILMLLVNDSLNSYVAQGHATNILKSFLYVIGDSAADAVREKGELDKHDLCV